MYAMTQAARNGRGSVVACGLVRAALHGANLLSAMRHNEAMRARLSEGFAGYLVTECGDSGAGYPFRAAREFHVHGFDRYCATSVFLPMGLRAVTGDIRGDRWCDAGGPIDAPVLIAAGSFVADQQNGSYFLRAGK